MGDTIIVTEDKPEPVPAKVIVVTPEDTAPEDTAKADKTTIEKTTVVETKAG